MDTPFTSKPFPPSKLTAGIGNNRKYGPLRVLKYVESAHIWYVRGRNNGFGPKFLSQFCGGINVIDSDVYAPVGWRPWIAPKPFLNCLRGGSNLES